jgi:DNA-directed RNA polymerase sigma subunit (sigma70/sigma32)
MTDEITGQLATGLPLDSRIETPETFDRITASLPRSDAPPSPNNLAVHRWHDPILEPGEVADLVRRAQAGDGRAKTTLLKRFHRKILKTARMFIPAKKLELDGPEPEDLVSAGGLGFLIGLNRYDPRRNSGLWTFAKWHVED